MVAREDHLLRLDLAALLVALLVDLQVQEARKQIEQAVARENFLPQIRRSVGPPCGSGGFPAPPPSPLLKGKKCVALPARRVVMNTTSVSTAKCTSVRRLNSKIGSRGSRSCWYWACVSDGLARQRILQFDRRHRNAIETDRHVQRLLGSRREMQLPCQAKAVRA